MKIEEVKCDFEILEFEDKPSLVINSRKKNSELYIKDKNLQEEVIEKMFNKKYRDLLYLVMDISSSDDSTETDGELALIKINDLRSKLINEYGKFISQRLLNYYLNMLYLLEGKINIKEERRGR